MATVVYIEATAASDARNWCIANLKPYTWRMNVADLVAAALDLRGGTVFQKNPDLKIAFEFIADDAANAFLSYIDPAPVETPPEDPGQSQDETPPENDGDEEQTPPDQGGEQEPTEGGE